MKRFTFVFIALLAVVAAPAAAMHHDKSEHAGHGNAKPAAHQGHGDHGTMLDLGSKAEKGVKGMAHLNDVRAAMAKAGRQETHHFMIMFHDDKTGKALESGKVAVKITAPGGAVSGPIELVGMDGHFGADVTLDKAGEYRFEVGSRLADGETRQFVFTTTLK